MKQFLPFFAIFLTRRWPRLPRGGYGGAIALGFAGLLLSWAGQARAQTFEIGVTSVLTMGQLPAALGRHAVQAYVTNNGTTTRTNLPVTLTISGVTTLSNVQTVAALAPGASALVKFGAYTPLTTGTNTITVTVPADNNNTNNSRSATQQVTSGTFCYAGAAEVPLNGRGISSNGQSAIVAAKFTAAAPVRLTSVSNFVGNYATNTGQPLTAVVMSAAGTILARSAPSTILSTDLNTRKFFTLLTPVTVTDDFLVGFLIANDQYTPIGCDTELPPRSGAFYFVDHTAFGGPPSELLAGDGSTSRLYVSAVGAGAPACSNPTNLTATAVTGTSAQLSFAPGNGNTSFLVSYAPASGGAAQTQTVAASPATLTGLLPGTAYLATVTGSCGAQTATPPAQLYFGTVPPNDQCTDPGVTSLACGQTVSGTTFGSTSTNDPTGSFNGNQIWAASGGVFYRLAGTGAPITLSMCGSSVIYDSQLFVLTGTCGSFTIVASDDDGCGALGDATMSLLTFNSVAGQNYLVYVSGYTGAQGSFSLTASCSGLPDLVVSTPQTVPGGAYRNVTVTGPSTGGAGTATLTAPLNVAGTLLVQNGGTLVANCQPITGVGGFQLAAGGTLVICDATGISLTANTGAVRVTGIRTFSNDASYTYNGVSTQITGDALPSRVRNLTVDNANDLTLSSGLTVSQVLRLTTGNLQTNNLALLLPSTATGTALVYNEGAGTVNGTATVQRYLTAGSNSGFGYRHYSAPVSNATVADLGTASFAPAVGNAYNVAAQPGLTTPFPTVFGYDQARLATTSNNLSSFDKGWLCPTGTGAALQVGQGYTVNLRGTELVDFVGTLNTGLVTVPMGRGTDPEAGWQFVGNPYPSPLRWDLVAPADRPGLDAAMYVFTSSSQYGGQYRAYTNGVGPGSPELPSAQGFFVRVSAGQSGGSLTFRNSQRVTAFGTQVAFQRGANDLRPQLELTLRAPDGLTDPTHIYFEAGASAAPDAAYDAEKLFNSNGVSLSSVAAGTELAINGLPAQQLAGLSTIPLTLRVASGAGTYSLTATRLLNLAPAQATVYLLDASTGQRINLHQQPTYTFSLMATEAATAVSQRFSVQFGPQAIPTGTQAALTAASVQVFPNPAHDQFTVLLPATGFTGPVELRLLNSLGQVVRTQTLALAKAGGQAEVETSTLAPGIYSLQLKAGGQLPIVKRVLLN